jgi:hypothetical protein
MSVGQVTSARYGAEGSRTIVLEGEWAQPEHYVAFKDVGHLFITVARSATQQSSVHCTVPPGDDGPVFELIGARGRPVTTLPAAGATRGFPERWRATLDCPWLKAKRTEQRFLVRVVAVSILVDGSLTVYDWEQWLLVTEPDGPASG